MTNEHEKLPSGMLADDKPLPSDMCCERVWEHHRFYPCRAKAKMKHEGKCYCGIHDPVRKKAKADERAAKHKAETDRSNQRYAEQQKLIADGRKYAAIEPLLRELLSGGGIYQSKPAHELGERIREVVQS